MVEVGGGWGYKKIYYNQQSMFDTKVSSLEKEVLGKLSEFMKQTLQSCNYSDESKSRDDEALKLLEYNNDMTRHQIESKLKEIEELKSQYSNYKSDIQLLSEEIKNRHEALLMVKKFYKKYLKLYYTVESREKDTQIILLQFFSEVRRDTDDFTVRLRRTVKTNTYELLESFPKFPASTKEELKELLQERNLPRALCRIRKAFLKVKQK